ncbi:MAG: trigger factor, partial [Chitinophagaceae bacterium]
MATITRENISLLNDKLVVKVAKDDYLPSFEQTLKKYAKNANIAGFRKGMVPKGMIKKMYGQNVFTEEVLRKVEKELNDFVTKEQLDIFAQPLPLESDARMLDMNNPGDYAFAFEIGLKPSFEVNTDNLKVTKYIIDVSDQSITEEIERLRKRHGTSVEQETISDDGNILTFLVTEGNQAGAENDEKQGREFTRLLRTFSESFRPKLMGLKKGDSLEATAAEAFDEKEKESFRKEFPQQGEVETRFNFLLEKIQALEPALMEESFFKEVYPEREITNEEDFRNAIKLEIEPYYESQAMNNMHDQIYHQLIDETKIEVPEN